LLPPLKQPPSLPPFIELRFLDTDDNGHPGVGGEEARLRRENADLWRRLSQASGLPVIERGSSSTLEQEIAHPEPPGSQQPASGEPSNVVPMKQHSSVYGVLADLNRGISSQHPAIFDASDPSGRKRGMP
jgi:hypothetical protein